MNINVVMIIMGMTLSLLIVEKSLAASSSWSVVAGSDSSSNSFEVVQGKQSIGSISFPSMSNDLAISIIPVRNVPVRRASISSIYGNENFNLAIEDSIIENVVNAVPASIINRQEIERIVHAELNDEPIPEEVYFDYEKNGFDDASIDEVESARTRGIKHTIKEQIKQEIVKAVEAKKEKITASLLSYELGSSVKTLGNNLSYTNFDIETRLDALNTSISGMASGDMIAKHGVWTQVSQSRARQKESKSIDEFKSQGTRMMLGYDFLTPEDNSYGVAYSLLSNEVYFKGGSKEFIRHNNYSIYGSHILTDKLYSPFSVSYGQAKIKTWRNMLWKKQRIVGRTKASTLNGKVGLAYNLDIPKYSLRITPLAHFTYEAIKLNGFTENGTRIAKNKNDIISSIIGASITKAIDFNKSKLIPELQYGYQRRLKGKVKDIEIQSVNTGEVIATNSQKLGSNSHTLTSSLTLARSGIYSYSLGHQYTKSQDKYTSHTGVLKLKINL